MTEKAKEPKTDNRPWWPSGLERVSNSSRHSLEDPGSNPARDYNIDRSRSESEMACHYSNSRSPGGRCAAYDIKFWRKADKKRSWMQLVWPY